MTNVGIIKRLFTGKKTVKAIKCVFMDKMYGVRSGDIITTENAYWMGDELIINSFITGDESEITYSAVRIVEMKVENAPNVRIPTPIIGKVVGKIDVDNFRNVTSFSIIEIIGM